jgi:glycosyltransferase involved in cell wall biosynthesis
LIEEFFPPHVGGAELMASYLTQGLAASGLETHVITRQNDPPCAAQEYLGRVRVRRIPPAGPVKGKGWRAVPAMLSFLLRLAILLVRESRRYDVLVVSGMKVIPLVAVPLARLLGKRCLIRVESSFELHEPISAASLGSMRTVGMALSRALQRIQRAVIGRADRVAAISDDIENLLRSFGVAAERIVKIPNAIDLDLFKPVSGAQKMQLRRRLAMPADKTIVLYAGRLSRAKGVEMLVGAWPQLVAAHPQLYLVIVGSGAGSFDDCEESVTDFIRTHSLEHHARMTGPSDRVYEYLQAADVFVFPSEYEGFSLGLIEALASALPVVVTAVGAAPQLIRDGSNGFLFAPQDAGALIRALDKCLAQRDAWARVGELARDSVQPYDLKVIVGQYAALCRALARSGSVS